MTFRAVFSNNIRIRDEIVIISLSRFPFQMRRRQLTIEEAGPDLQTPVLSSHTPVSRLRRYWLRRDRGCEPFLEAQTMAALLGKLQSAEVQLN